MRDRRIRPFILLDAYYYPPGKPVSLMVTAAATKGAQQIRLDTASAALVKPGYTLIPTKLSQNPILIKAIQPGGIAVLSRGLPEDLPAGKLDTQTALVPPFPRPVLPDGKPNPAFDEPMNGWLDLLRATTAEVLDIFRNNDVDLLIFNGGGSPVLDVNRYHDPPLPEATAVPLETTFRAIMANTIKWVRDPKNGLSGAGVIDGFSNRRWGDTGATTATGVTAFSRHLSVTRMKFTPEMPPEPDKWRDIKGNPMHWLGPSGRADTFTPRYQALFPELPLTGLSTVPLLADLSPTLTADALGAQRGRATAPVAMSTPVMSGSPVPPPEVAITAFALHPGDTADDGTTLTVAETRHITTKSVLRTLAAYVGKGVSTVAFYEPDNDTELAADADPTGGETLQALKRFLGPFDSPAQITAPRPIVLASVGDCSNARQFDGDGTAAHPPLFNRDVVAFFPFQLSDNQFIAAVYVMTRDLGRVQAAATGASRFDLPPQTFTLGIDRVNGETAQVTATDPLTGLPVEVKVRTRAASRIWVEMPLSDSPRLLQISEP
jgi:hypothetical protein